MGRLDGKVAVVTGASKGIGAGIARALAAEGASVVVNYSTDRAGAEAVVADIERAGGRAVAVQGSVAKGADVARLFEEATRALGPVGILVNNAGVYGMGPVEAFEEAEYRRQFDTNVLGLLLATREAVKGFGPGGGSVINVGSVISRLTPPGSVIYSATKGAVDAVTRVLAKELGPKGIRVNSINPGAVDTEGSRSAGMAGTDFETTVAQGTPLGRIGQPGDIAPVAVFLASDEAHWVTGELLSVAGGF